MKTTLKPFDVHAAETRALGLAELAQLQVQRPESEAGQRVLHGYAAVFWDPGRPEETSFEVRPGVRERWLPGAFDDVLANPRPAPFDTLCLFDHEQRNLLGRHSAGTLRLSVDRVGLRYECDLPGNQLADELVEQIERGDVVGSSLKWIGAEERMVRDPAGVAWRELIRIHLLIDVGPGVRAAYTGASAEVSARTVDAWLAEQEREAKRRRDRVRRLRLGRLN